MPLSDTGNGTMRRSSGTAREHVQHGGRRAGWPMVVDDTPTSMLAPLLSNFQGMGISSLKGFLSPPKAEALGLPAVGPEESFSHWQQVDLGDGPKRIILISSPSHALQMFAFENGVIPDDPHVQEVFPAPTEVASIPVIVQASDMARSSLEGVPFKGPVDGERVVSSHILAKTHWKDRGPVVAVITLAPGPGRDGNLALVLISLATGKAFHRLGLGTGSSASVSSSARAIVVATSTPPMIHVLDSKLEAIHSPIATAPPQQRNQLPVLSLSGRLLAYATSEPALTPGADGLGSIIARSSRPRTSSSTPQPPPAQTAQGVLLSSAVEIGGGVARGVWAGLKMGAKAASQASSGRLAQSAPNERFLAPVGSPPTAGESRSVQDDLPVETVLPSGVWIKIVDLFPRVEGPPELIAHFRLPPRSLVPSGMPGQQHTSHFAREYPVTFLSFNAQGSRLLAAAADGRVFHVLDVRSRSTIKHSSCKGEVWNAYVLRRGNTTADVRSVTWSFDDRWVAVGTGKGTIHVFPISPSGGQPSAASHVPLKIANPTRLYPLSIEVAPYARLRAPRAPSAEDFDAKADADLQSGSYAVASFVSARRHPIDKGKLCQDVAIYRPSSAQVEVARMTAYAVPPPAAVDETGRRGSNLTEMMRERAGLRPGGDLIVEQATKARWALPLGQGASEDPSLLSGAAGKAAPGPRQRNLYHAEIKTHSDSPNLLPVSLYLAHQVEFYGAVPTDDYSPLSVLDKVARTRRLVFRPEVQVRPSDWEAQSFDEPLNTALHSVLESRPATQLPQLPNGSPSKGSLWSAIPIRHVAANLGEGVDRVRREYARVQHRRRRANLASGNSLSFEDDTVFANRPPTEGSGEDADADSSPSSAFVPKTDSSLAGGEDDDWGDGWEVEYQRAVEDDGCPDDLVLGLLDEEEEERRQRYAQLKEKTGRSQK